MSAVVTTAARSSARTYRGRTVSLLGAIGRSIWRALESEGHRRAAVALQALSERYERCGDPGQAARLRVASRFRPN